MLKIRKVKDLSIHLIVIDYGSSVQIFNSEEILINLLCVNKDLQLLANPGELSSSMIVKFGVLMTWHNQYSVANILGLSRVAKKCRVFIDACT